VSAPMDPVSALWLAERDFAEPPLCCGRPRIFETRATVGAEEGLPIKVCRSCGAWRFEFHNGWNPAECPAGFQYFDGAGLLIVPHRRAANGVPRFVEALERAVGVADEGDTGFRVWVWHHGLPFARAGRLYAEPAKGALDAAWLRRALAIVLVPVVEGLVRGAKCGCTDRDPVRCCEAALHRLGLSFSRPQWPCHCRLCHAGEGGMA
jgi:hypothetical protein